MSVSSVLCAQYGLLYVSSLRFVVLRAVSSSRDLPVIQVPRRLQARVGKAGKAVTTPRAGSLLISSRRPELNQPVGKTCGLWDRPELVSRGWKHREARGDHFTIRRLQQESPGPEPDRSFESMGLEHRLVEALNTQGISSPTWVQSRTVPILLRGRNVLCAAETGSGKTLGYLLPMVQRLLEQRAGGHPDLPDLSNVDPSTSPATESSPLVNHFQSKPHNTLNTGDSLSTNSMPDPEESNNHPSVATSVASKPFTNSAVQKHINRSLPNHFLTRTQNSSSSSDPQNLILVPSRELANQVGSVAWRLCSRLGITVRVVGGGRGPGAVDKQFSKGPVDILVSTPGALWKALRRDTVSLQELNFVVLDEADTLFDESFSGLVEDILMQTQIAYHSREVGGLERKAQLVAIGATFPGGVGQLLSKVMDIGSIATIKSNKLHFLMPHVQQTFLKVKGADKVAELIKLLKEQAVDSKGAGVLVFCNSSSTVNWLGYILDDHSIKHSRLQGQMPAIMRSGIFESFQKGQTDVLLCTDIASRGLDSRRVEVVVNYDFPATLQDYLHRVGRVGRVGSEKLGSVLSFVTHAWDVELVQKIETAARRRSSLPGMEHSIKKPVPQEELFKENADQSYSDNTVTFE